MKDFGCSIQEEMPRLRRYARALTRDTTTADIHLPQQRYRAA